MILSKGIEARDELFERCLRGLGGLRLAKRLLAERELGVALLARRNRLKVVAFEIFVRHLQVAQGHVGRRVTEEPHYPEEAHPKAQKLRRVGMS